MSNLEASSNPASSSASQSAAAISPEEQRLQAYFDGELSAEERAEVEFLLQDTHDPASVSAQAQLDDWRVLQALTSQELEAEVNDLPEARFEQMWDAVDSRLAAGDSDTVPSSASISWSERLFRRLGGQGLRWGVPAAAALALVVVFVGQSQQGGGPSVHVADPGIRASTPEASGTPMRYRTATLPAAEETGSGQATELVDAPDPAADGGAPSGGESPAGRAVEIENIEFGGRKGEVTQLEGDQGTATVIWIVDDEDPPSDQRNRVTDL